MRKITGIVNFFIIIFLVLALYVWDSSAISLSPLPFCSPLDTSKIPLTPYSNGYWYFDGNFKLLRGRNMPAVKFKMSITDSLIIQWRMKMKLPYKAAYFMGTGEGNWVIGTGTGCGSCIEIFNPAVGSWKTIYSIGTQDSSWRTYKLVWHKSDLILKCYMNDTLQNSYTSYIWPDSYTTQPFTIGHGNVVSTSVGPGTIPVSPALYFKGYVDYVGIHKYQGTSDSSFIYQLNEGGQVIYDSSSYKTYVRTSPDGSALGSHLQNGFGPTQDSSDAVFISQENYTSIFTPAGNNGLFNYSGALNYWADSHLWGACVYNDSSLAVAGTINRINADYLNPNSGNICNGVAKYNINTSAWSTVGAGVDNNYAENILQYKNDLVMIGPFTSVGGVPNTLHIAKWNGAAWSALGTGLNNNAKSLAVWGDSLYVGGIFTLAGGISANNIAKWNGTSWASLGAGCNNEIEDMKVFQGNLYAGGRFTTSGGITTNAIAKWNGAAWSAVGTGVIPGQVVYCLQTYNGELYAGGDFTSMNGIGGSLAAWNGSTWRGVTSTSGFGNAEKIRAMAVFNNTLYAGGVFYYAGGKSVNKLFKTDGNNICAVNFGFDGEIWGIVPIRNALYIIGEFNYADGSQYNSILKIDSIITGIAPVSTEVPKSFYLEQNYPNPFNPVTKIKFGVPSLINEANSLDIKLRIYNILGKEVSVLVDCILNPGTYEVIFNAEDLPSGVYFYSLGSNSGNFSESKKMILLK